MLIPKKYYRHS